MDPQIYTTETNEQPEAEYAKLLTSLPLVVLRGMAVFPGMIFHFDISRKKSILALEEAMKEDQELFLASQKNEDQQELEEDDIYSVGCIAQVKQCLKMNEELSRILVEVQDRARIVEYTQTEPYFEVLTETLVTSGENNDENAALLKLILTSFTEYVGMSDHISESIIPALEMIDNADLVIDLICTNLDLDVDRAQRLLSETNTSARLLSMYKVLLEENQMLQLELQIDEKVKDEMDRTQRDYLLREQIRAIQDELGEDDEDQIQQYLNRLEKVAPPKEVAEKVETEIARLRKTPPGSSESSVIETYLDWILDMPWHTMDKENLDVANARKILNEDHFALENVKERMLEYISVLQLSKSLKSPILCLVGPPGVGKTSIAKSIARALGRKYVRLSLGGMRDEAEIRGHRRTYLGAIPGRIIYHLKTAKTKNPLFLLDEIDKMSQDFKGDPASALLEVLDPEQNSTFTDNYLELPFDLSHVLFITTANSLSTIPAPLLDRMEIIEVNGYVETEKFQIATRYLIPQLLAEHGIHEDQLKISPNALNDIIRYYTRESGVRELKRQLARVMRISAKEIVEKHKKLIQVNSGNLEKFLGLKKYLFDPAGTESYIGLVNGLAWTSVGGETLEIEVVVVPGKGKVEITGQLGDVMQESVKAAISYIRSRVSELGVPADFHEKNDIHLHVPEGAVPKDGPSAGITIATALISALTGKPVPGSLAMTGEITLRGRVLPIGGLREKLAAAHRAGMKTIILPKENEKDLEEVQKLILKSFNIIPVADMTEVVKKVFGDENACK